MWKLQQGSYIPKVSGAQHAVGLAKDVFGSLKGIDKAKESISKYGSKLAGIGGVGKFLGGKLAGFGGKKLAGMLAKTAFGATPMGMLAGVALPMVLDRMMKHGGGEGVKALAKKFGLAKAPEIAARGEFGLHTDKYKELGELPGQIESELTGTSAGEATGGLSLNEMWRNLPGGKESAAGVLRGAREQIFGKSGGTGTGGLGLSSPLASLTGGSPTLQLPTTPTSIAGMESGLTGLNFNQPESLGNIPSLPSDATDISSLLGDGASGDMWAGGNDWQSLTGDEPYFQQQGGYMQGYQEGGEANNGILSKLNQLSDMQKFYEGEGPRTESGDLKFGPKGMITREGLAEQYNFPLEEAVFDTSYGEPGSENMAIDISIPSDDRLMKYQRSGNMPEKKAEFMSKSAEAEQSMRKAFPDEYQSLATDIGFGDYAGAAEKVGSGWLDMSPLERMRSKTSSLGSKKNIPSESDEKKQMMMKALGMEESEYDSFMKWKKSKGMQMGGMMPGGVSNALPYQQGGSISPYNLGGSVTQQPMAYQLGGLLKYKRSPMMG